MEEKDIKKDDTQKKKRATRVKKDKDENKKDTKVKRVTRKKEEPKIDIDNQVEAIQVKEVIVEKKTGFNYAEVVVIMIITLILGGIIGSFITHITRGTKIINKTIIKDEIPSEMTEFLQTYENIVNDYYEKVDSKELLEAGINGMLNYLGDDYSVYMDKEATESFNQQVEGKYTGIGVEIMLQEEGGVVINKVFDKSPAYSSGLKIGDVFLKIDGVDVTEKNASEIASMIKGSNKSEVEIVVKRDNQEKTFKLTLKEVEIESVISKTFTRNDKKVGYIQIGVFAANTYSQFSNKLAELEKDNIDSLIIDVRDNSGGYLSTVTDMASLFLDKSKIIYQLDTKGVVEQIYSKTNASRKYNIVVLVNQNSASASEILAAALQESYGAKVIGINSFGKGTVQKAYQLESGATVKYTIQKWLTPKGNWINETGVTPDIKEELSNDYFQNPSDDTDNQLQKAIEELTK